MHAEGPERRRGQALLVGDTSAWYHWGCSCTSLALHSELRKRWTAVTSVAMHRLVGLQQLPRTPQQLDEDGVFAAFRAAHPDIVEAIERSDRVYINGEGTLHGTGESALALLYLARIAGRRLGREVHLINHSCYPDDAAELAESPAVELYRLVYSDLDFVAVREGISFALLKAMGVSPVQAFDCLPLFVQSSYSRADTSAATGKRVVIAGSAAWGAGEATERIAAFVRRLSASGLEPVVLLGASRLIASDDVHFAERLAQTARGCFEVCFATSEREWLRTIDQAAVLVSGRFHHSIAAAFLDTPFVVMESNTPKIAGLLEMLGVDPFVSIAEPQLEERLLRKVTDVIEGTAAAPIGDEAKGRLRALARENFV